MQQHIFVIFLFIFLLHAALDSLLCTYAVQITQKKWECSCRMVSTTVLYGCHAIVSAALAFKAHAVRRAVRQQQSEAGAVLFHHT